MAAIRTKKIRYAVVGLGYIAQIAVLPAFRHARKNSILAALVSGDPKKRLALSRQYKVPATFSYDDYDDCLRGRWMPSTWHSPELLYFSECILRNRQPEPSGEEGMQDVRIVEALYESAEIGKAVELPPYAERSYPTLSQEIRRSPVKRPELVNARQPST